VLDRYDRKLLRGLGFPKRYAELLTDFTVSSPDHEPPIERDLRIESLGRLAELQPKLSKRARRGATALAVEPPAPLLAAPRRFPVERVLRDL
jgi:hypothetical protein